MSDEILKAKSLSIGMKLSIKSDTYLNNLLNDIKVRYDISDNDWISINTAVAVLMQRELIKKSA